MAKKQTPETALKQSAKQLLSSFRIWTFPVLQGMGAHPGIADRLGIWEKGQCPHCGGQIPQALALEFKRPQGIMSRKQKEFQEEWQERGGLYVPIWKIEDMIEALHLPIKGLF